MQKGEWDMGSIRDLIVEGAGRYDQSDPEGLAATYADDAVLTAPPGERAEGKRAILDYWAQMVRAFTNKTSVAELHRTVRAELHHHQVRHGALPRYTSSHAA